MKEYLVHLSFTATKTFRVMAEDADKAVEKANDELWFGCGLRVESSELVSPPLAEDGEPWKPSV